MLRRLQHKASGHTWDVTILRAPAEDLPFDNGSFDVAASTLVLCGVDDQSPRRGVRAASSQPWVIIYAVQRSA
jgi:hypothetical protein